MKKILLVEDDALVARIYSRKLVEACFEVLVAADGLEALQQLTEFKPDLVVLDLLMPKLSGVDVLRYIRKQPALESTRVVVFSNAFLNKLGAEVATLGVDEMLLKTAVTPDQLIETVTAVLERQAAAAHAPNPIHAAKPPPRPPLAAVPPPAAPEPERVQPNERARAFRERIWRDFFEQIPVISKTVRQACQDFLEAPDPAAQSRQLENLGRKIGFLTHMTSLAGCHRIAQLSSALEALLFELREKPAPVDESSRHTVDSAGALLVDCLARANLADEQCLSPTTILVVDDDAVLNRAITLALGRAELTATSVLDPLQALEKLRQNAYDAVLLDINLPGMTGITLCEQMRELPLHANTPVIFITSYAEFEERARAILGKGDDLIGKPVMPMELTVKIITQVLKRRLNVQAVEEP
jgi:CheY-like chemotaxis protein